MAAAMIADGEEQRSAATSHLSAPGPVLTSQAPTFVATPAPAAQAASDDAVDAELLDIFLGEAEEVLENVAITLPLLRMASHDQASLTTLRRAFHTLKGSGRMVGLNAFGEAAWGLEKTLNLALSDGKPASADLCDLIERAHRELSAWVRDLKESGTSARRPDALVFAAESVRDGGKLPAEEATPLTAPDVTAPVSPYQPEVAAGAQYHPDTLESVDAIALAPDTGPAPSAAIEHVELDVFDAENHVDHVAIPQPELMDLLSPEHLQAHPADAVQAQDDLLAAAGEVQLPELPA
jgi:chemosensory pili system protein ChpA (sensor histidine kinase/response regulator)